MEQSCVVIINKMCRLCLNIHGDVNIFENEDLIEEIFLFTGIKVTHSNKMPQKICNKCIEILNNAKQLRLRFKKNDCNMKLLLGIENEDNNETSSVNSGTGNIDNNGNVEKKNDKKVKYQCYDCLKVFDKPKKLYLHKRTHNKIECCPIDGCSKSFATKSDVVKHVRTHTGERPYECSLCPMKFSQRATLNSHRSNVHSDVCS